jgi:hypothetical protein
MKYMLLLVRSDDEWEALGDDERDYEAIGRFWAEQAQSGRLLSGYELQPARTATTVAWDEGRPIILDGPYLETKETIGGYGIIDVEDLDAAITVAKTWPARGHKVEIRPVVERR